MKKNKKIKRLKKRVDELHRERALQGTIIENQRQEILRLDEWRGNQRQYIVEVEQAIRGVRAGQPNPGVSDFGRGWSQCMSDVEAALLMAQTSKPVRVIDQMELQSVSFDLEGMPHTSIQVLDSHNEEGTGTIVTSSPLGAALMGGSVPDDTNHFINLTPNGWTIQHPLACRETGTLFDCPVTKAAEDHDWSVMEVDPYPTGTYPCAATPSGALVIDLGAPVGTVARRKIKDNPQA